jgi:hypothetical protein
MLRLQTEGIPTVVDLAVSAGHTAVQKIAGVELHSRLIGQHFQHAACRWLVGLGSQLNFLPSVVEHPILVVPTRQLELLVVGIDA